MKLPESITFEATSIIFNSKIFIIEFVGVDNKFGELYKLEIYNDEFPSFRIHGDWQKGCCIEGVKESDSVDHILTAAEQTLFKATKDGKI